MAVVQLRARLVAIVLCCSALIWGCLVVVASLRLLPRNTCPESGVGSGKLQLIAEVKLRESILCNGAALWSYLQATTLQISRFYLTMSAAMDMT